MADAIDRLPLDHSNIEVLGYKVRATDPAWTGLDWSRPQLRTRTKLALPWCHPSDQTGSPEDFDCIYALYPRPEIGKRWKRKIVGDVWFEQSGEKWFVAVKYATP